MAQPHRRIRSMGNGDHRGQPRADRSIWRKPRQGLQPLHEQLREPYCSCTHPVGSSNVRHPSDLAALANGSTLHLLTAFSPFLLPASMVTRTVAVLGFALAALAAIAQDSVL